MTRSKRMTELASRLGRSPGTVEGHQRRGMWPEANTDLARHYEVMDACGLGSGKDDWIVALQAAVRFDWPTVRLRSALGRIPVDGPLMQLVSGLLISTATRSDALTPYAEGGLRDTTGREPVENIARDMAADAFNGVRRLLRSEKTDAEDFVAMAEIVTTFNSQGGSSAASTVNRVTGSVPGDDLSGEVHEVMAGRAENLNEWPSWIAQAQPMELVAAVKFSALVVESLERASPSVAVTETQHWECISALAPMCGVERSVLPPVIELLRLGATRTSEAPEEP